MEEENQIHEIVAEAAAASAKFSSPSTSAEQETSPLRKITLTAIQAPLFPQAGQPPVQQQAAVRAAPPN